MTYFEIDLPNSFHVFSKKISVNLNTYRNLNYHVNNNLKKKYKKYIENIIIKNKIKKPIELMIKYFPKNLNSDLDNLMIHFKYLNDALQDIGVIENDNVKWIKKISVEFCGIGEKKITCICKDYKG